MQSTMVDLMVYDSNAYLPSYYRRDSPSSPPRSDALEPFISMTAQAAASNDWRRLEELYEAYPALSLNYMDLHGLSALMYAAMNGHIATVKKLIELQANVDLQNPYSGDTALHFAAQCGHTRTAELLVRDGGANIVLKNAKGKTAFDLARDFGHGENKVMKRLFEVGPSAAEALRSGSSEESLVEASEPKGIKKKIINKNDSILPCHLLLKKFAKTGCYCFTPGKGLGLMLLARNGTVETMLLESAQAAQCFSPDALLVYLTDAVENFTNDRLFLHEWQVMGQLTSGLKSRQDALAFYNEWREENLKKLKNMISYLNLYKQSH